MIKLVYALLTCLIFSPALADTTFVSGTIVSQTWTPAGSPYCLTGNILVATLTIQPGVRVVALGNHVFEVGGVLTAVGAPLDSIIFTKAGSVVGWQGIFFNFSSPGSELAYCRIEKSTNSGIRIANSVPVIRNCTIAGNSGILGGGLSVAGSLNLTDCRIADNIVSLSGNGSVSQGGGIYVVGALTMTRCSVIANRSIAFASGQSEISSTSYGGGIYVSGPSSLMNCTITNNIAQATAQAIKNGIATSRGGGLYSTGVCILRNCIFGYDSSLAFASGFGSSGTQTGGGAMFAPGGSASVTNSTFAYNVSRAIRAEADTVRVSNSILYFNLPNTGQWTGIASVEFSDVQGGNPGPGNINVNPVFASLSDLRIVPGSSCIDAGDSSAASNDGCRPPGLGTERNDMGAHGGPSNRGWLDSCVVAAVEELPIRVPSAFALFQNYPNPFNPETRIKYHLPATSGVNGQAGIPSSTHVTLKVFDLLGREAATLVNESLQPGAYEAMFDGSNSASGVYFYRLNAGNFVGTRKLLLLR